MVWRAGFREDLRLSESTAIPLFLLERKRRQPRKFEQLKEILEVSVRCHGSCPFLLLLRIKCCFLCSFGCFDFKLRRYTDPHAVNGTLLFNSVIYTWLLVRLLISQPILSSSSSSFFSLTRTDVSQGFIVLKFWFFDILLLSPWRFVLQLLEMLKKKIWNVLGFKFIEHNGVWNFHDYLFSSCCINYKWFLGFRFICKVDWNRIFIGTYLDIKLKEFELQF